MADNVTGCIDLILTWLDPDCLCTYFSWSPSIIVDTMIDINGTLAVK